jgi:hypothetical protein
MQGRQSFFRQDLNYPVRLVDGYGCIDHCLFPNLYYTGVITGIHNEKPKIEKTSLSLVEQSSRLKTKLFKSG